MPTNGSWTFDSRTECDLQYPFKDPFYLLSAPQCSFGTRVTPGEHMLVASGCTHVGTATGVLAVSSQFRMVQCVVDCRFRTVHTVCIAVLGMHMHLSSSSESSESPKVRRSSTTSTRPTLASRCLVDECVLPALSPRYVRSSTAWNIFSTKPSVSSLRNACTCSCQNAEPRAEKACNCM